MKYATATIAVCFAMLGCGSGDGPGPEGGGRETDSVVGLLNRGATPRDVFPGATEDLRLQGVVVNGSSARRAVALKGGFSVWVLRGEQSGPPVLAEGGNVVCLAVLRRGAAIAAKCAAETVLGDAERLMIVLSGGAAGAPGLRPREVVAAGVVDDPAADVELVTDEPRVDAVANVAGVYWAHTRSTVKGIVVRWRDGDAQFMKFDACQKC